MQPPASGPREVMNDPSPHGDASEVPVVSAVTTNTRVSSSNEAPIFRSFLDGAGVIFSTAGAMSVPEMHGYVRGRIAR